MEVVVMEVVVMEGWRVLMEVVGLEGEVAVGVLGTRGRRRRWL